MSFLKPEEKSKIVEGLLREYIKTSIEGAGDKPLTDIVCVDGKSFQECHIIVDTKIPMAFGVNSDRISSGAEVPDYVNDFPVYLCWNMEMLPQGVGEIFRVWAFWGDIKFK